MRFHWGNRKNNLTFTLIPAEPRRVKLFGVSIGWIFFGLMNLKEKAKP